MIKTNNENGKLIFNPQFLAKQYDRILEENKELRDKVSRRNAMLKSKDAEIKQLKVKGIYRGLELAKKEVMTSIDSLKAVERIEDHMTNILNNR